MRILLGLLREIPKWDRASQIALVIAVILLVLDLVILSSNPDLQTPALIGAVGLLLGIQGIFMWGNRNMVTPYTRAQRHFINGEFEEVVTVLKQYIEEDEHPSIDALILLGNAYRTLGKVVESESVLRIALARRNDYHFALYGLGKTLLAKGKYEESQEFLEEAIRTGAPQTTNFDIALAFYLLGNIQASTSYIDKLPPLEEAYRNLFVAYILQNIDDASVTEQLKVAGLPFWEAEAERFKSTPYGQTIAHHVEIIKNL